MKQTLFSKHPMDPIIKQMFPSLFNKPADPVVTAPAPGPQTNPATPGYFEDISARVDQRRRAASRAAQPGTILGSGAAAPTTNGGFG